LKIVHINKNTDILDNKDNLKRRNTYTQSGKGDLFHIVLDFGVISAINNVSYI
jgi:hypothetical protein